MTSDVVLSPVTEADASFVDELLLADAEELFDGLPAEQRDELALLQVRARNVSYTVSYPDAQDQLIVVDGEPLGRLLLDEQADAVHVVDIRIVAQRRGNGMERRC